jgi:hypothetical protein
VIQEVSTGSNIFSQVGGADYQQNNFPASTFPFNIWYLKFSAFFSAAASHMNEDFLQFLRLDRGGFLKRPF